MNSFWTGQAEDDLRSIVARLEAFSAGSGDRFAVRIRRRVLSLEEMPGQGRIVPEYGLPVLREVIIRPYRIIYEVFPDRLEIVAIRHGRERLETDEESS